MERKYKDGDKVGGMVVEGAILTLFGWKYKLRMPKTNGTADRRLKAWHFFESDLQTEINNKIA